MKLSELFRAMGRRWYVVVVGVLVVTGFAFLTLRVIPLSYDVKSSILLLPPTSNLDKGDNPFLNLGGLDVAAGVLAKSLTDSESARSIVPAGSTAKYTVQKDASVSGSVLEVAVSDTSASGAFRILDAVLSLADTRMRDLQVSAKALPTSEIRLMVITNNTVAEPNFSSLARTLIVVVAAGLVFTLLLAVSVDSLARRRALRKQRSVEKPIREPRRRRGSPPLSPVSTRDDPSHAAVEDIADGPDLDPGVPVPDAPGSALAAPVDRGKQADPPALVSEST